MRPNPHKALLAERPVGPWRRSPRPLLCTLRSIQRRVQGALAAGCILPERGGAFQ